MVLHGWTSHWQRRFHHWWRVLRRQSVVPVLDAGWAINIQTPPARTVREDVYGDVPHPGVQRVPALRRVAQRKVPKRTARTSHAAAARRQRV